MIITLVVAFFVSLIVEIPFMNLDKVMFGKKGRKKSNDKKDAHMDEI